MLLAAFYDVRQAYYSDAINFTNTLHAYRMYMRVSEYARENELEMAN